MLDHLQAAWAPAAGSKRRRAGSAAGAAAAPLSLDALVSGRARLDAARWFFELLVLKGRGLVDLQQPAEFGDIEVLPTASLAAGGPAAAAALPSASR